MLWILNVTLLCVGRLITESHSMCSCLFIYIYRSHGTHHIRQSSSGSCGGCKWHYKCRVGQVYCSLCMRKWEKWAANLHSHLTHSHLQPFKPVCACKSRLVLQRATPFVSMMPACSPDHSPGAGYNHASCWAIGSVSILQDWHDAWKHPWQGAHQGCIYPS